MGWSDAFTYGVDPFVFGDAIKLAVAAVLLPAGWALLQRVHWPLLKRSTAAAALLVFTRRE